MIVAVSNSDPRSIESVQQPQRKAWRGRCLVVVKAGNEPGEVRLTAQADGLTPGEATITMA
jgi:beta-galactosidase